MIDVDPFRASACCDGLDWMWSYEVTSPGSYIVVVASLNASLGVSIPRKMSWYWGVIHFIISMFILLWYRLSNYSCRCFVSFYHAMPWGTHYSYLILVAQGLIYDVLLPFANKLSPSDATSSWETFHSDLHLKRVELTQISNNLLVKAREIFSNYFLKEVTSISWMTIFLRMGVSKSKMASLRLPWGSSEYLETFS